MNVSFDDTNPSISFSPEWRVQPANSADASVLQSWQGTYHASQSYGAQATVTFNGAGIYVYGSKGPGNANYSVQVDDRVFYLPGYSPTTKFQQLLFGQALRQGSYTLVLTNESQNPEAWLDLDFIMITTALPAGAQSQTNPGSFATTKAFIPPSGSLSLPPPPGSTKLGDSSSSSQSNDSQTPKILAILFGALLGAVLLGLVLFVLLRKRAARRRAEQEFRYGSATPGDVTVVTRSVASPIGIPPATYNPQQPQPQQPYITPISPFTDDDRASTPSVVQIGKSVALLDGDAASFARSHSRMSATTSFSGASSYGALVDGGKGKEWRPQPPPPLHKTHTHQGSQRFGSAAQSIRTGVQVMDEE